MIIFYAAETRYCLDRRAGKLWRGESGREPVHLAPKDWEVLLCLAERPGELISKSALQDAVWGADNTAVSETSVSKAISNLRLAFKDQPKTPTAIETIPGRGFRFIARVESTNDEAPGSSKPRTALDPYATVPPLPPTFFGRPEISEPLRETLTNSSGIVGVTAVEGMGGVGKTLMAIGICSQPEVRQAFPDGIVWLTIGKESKVTVAERVKFIAHALNTEFSDYSEIEYRSLLKDKAVLVVLDDIWATGDIEPFRISSGRSRILYTTRDRTIAGALGAASQDVGVLDDEQARRFLSSWTGRENTSLPEPYASGIVSECRGLALGIAMIGGALKGQPDSEWANLLDDLKKARLKDIGVRPGGYAHETLHATIEVSVNALMADRTRYLQLAVLLEDMSAPPALLRALWGGEEREVRRIMRLFVDRSLARRDAEGHIRLHDLQLDYIRGEHPDQEALRLQHSALLLSLHVVLAHPEQFGAQMTGRLLAHAAHPGIAMFLEQLGASVPRPRLRPLLPALAAAGGPALRVLEGHSNTVDAVAVTPDGRCAVSGSKDKTVRVWDLRGNQPARVLVGHSNQVTAVAVTADGRRAVSGSYDKTVRVWDLERNKPSRVLGGHTFGVSGVSVTSDGRCAVSGSYDKTVRVWDLERNEPPRVLEGHTGRVSAMAMTADGKRAVLGCDRTLQVWDLEGNKPRLVRDDLAYRVKAVAVTGDGKRAIFGFDALSLVWDLEANKSAFLLDGHTRTVNAVAVTADGKWAVSGSDDKTVRVWDLDGSRSPLVPEGLAGLVNAVAVTADGRWAVFGCDDNTVRVWDVEGNELPRVLNGHADSVYAVAVTSDGKWAVSGSKDETVRVWDLEGNRQPVVLEGHRDFVSAVAVTAEGKRVVSGSEDNTVRVWDLEGNQPPRVLEGYIPNAVAITADGQRVISGNRSALRIWDLEGNQPPRMLRGHRDYIYVVAVTADGRWAVSGSDDKTARVWDLEANQPPVVLEGHRDFVRAVAVTTDGKWAVSGSRDSTLRVWDLSRGICLNAFSCDAPLTSCAWAGARRDRIIATDAGGQIHMFAWEE